TDPQLPAHYSADDLTGKAACKAALQKRCGLPDEADAPVLGVIARLVEQKGIDLIGKAAPGYLHRGTQLVVLGDGDPVYHAMLEGLGGQFPDRVSLTFGFNGGLAHQIEAGADLFLMPSLYEPSGLNQMYSMRYGTVPIVRATGGLDDTVENFHPETGKGNGFKFGPYSAPAMLEKIREAIYFYSQPDIWAGIQ